MRQRLLLYSPLFIVMLILLLCAVLAKPADDQQLRLSKLEARVTILSEQVKQLKIACGEDRPIKEYVWRNSVGEFHCRSCEIVEEK